jgi:hypothetical protein
MDNNTHGEFWAGEINGEKISMFIDGVPDKCKHDDKGEVMSFNDNYEYFKESEIPNYKTDYEGWLKFQKDHKISGGCVSCSKCGKPFSPPMY